MGRAATMLMQNRYTAVGQLVQDLLTQVRAGPEPRELQGIRQALSRARAMLSAELGPEKLLPPERLGKVPQPQPPQVQPLALHPPSSISVLAFFLCTPLPVSRYCYSDFHPLTPLPTSCSSGPLSPDLVYSPLPELVLEKSLHRSVLKPLRPILAARLRRRLSTDGSLGRLAEGFQLARTQGLGAFGSHLHLSSPVETEQVRQKLLQLLRTYSPSAQIKRLLQACKLLYTALKTQAGMPLTTSPYSALSEKRLSPLSQGEGPRIPELQTGHRGPILGLRSSREETLSSLWSYLGV